MHRRKPASKVFPAAIFRDSETTAIFRPIVTKMNRLRFSTGGGVETMCVPLRQNCLAVS